MLEGIKRNSNESLFRTKFIGGYSDSLADVSVSKSLVKLFTFVHFILALDYGFVECANEAISLCLRLFPLMQACCVTIAAVYSMVFIETGFESRMFDAMLMSKYVLSALVLFIYRNKMSFKEFHNELYKIDRSLGISIRLETKIILTIIINAILVSINLLVSISFYSEFILFSFCCYCLPLISNAIPSIVMFFTFYETYLRLKHVEYKIINENNVDIIYYQRVYKCLADLIELSNETMNWMYACVLLFCVPNMLMQVYYVIFIIFHSWDTAMILLVAIYATIFSVLTFAPAFSAGVLTSQAEKIAIALHNKLLFEQPNNDEFRKCVIEAFIMYTKLRPFKYCVMEVVPLGWSLPVVVLNIVITYTLVILQFSHIV